MPDPRSQDVAKAAQSQKPHEDVAAQKAQDIVKPGVGARVIVDTSGSMQGFVIKGSVSLETIHRVVDEVLSKHSLNVPEQRCLLGSRLVCGQKLEYRDYRNVRLYRELESRVDLALVRPKKAPEENPAALPPVDNLDPFHITVIVTDGMQASSAPAGAISQAQATGSDVACASGPDPNCIGSLLRERAKEGYGVWLVGIRLPFKGQHFAERALDASHWQRITEHIKTLARDPKWYPQKFAGSRLSTNPKTGTSSYYYEGVKPLLFFVLSRDIGKGRAFVGDLVNRLRQERIAVPVEEGVQSFELWPVGATEYRFAGVSRQEGPNADKVLLDRPTLEARSFLQPIRCTQDGSAYLEISISKSRVGLPLPPFVQENIAIVSGDKSLDPKIVKFPSQIDASRFKSGINCRFLQTGTWEASFRLLLRRTVSGEYPADIWWVTWSSDNSYEMPERTYGLREVVDLVVRPLFTAEVFQAELRFRITRE